jgi:hypothetical protein
MMQIHLYKAPPRAAHRLMMSARQDPPAGHCAFPASLEKANNDHLLLLPSLSLFNDSDRR